jgi:hypothetical protein
MRKLQEVKEELHGSSDGEEEGIAGGSDSVRPEGAVTRFFINEESVDEEEEEGSEGLREERRIGEQVLTQNVSPSVPLWS